METQRLKTETLLSQADLAMYDAKRVGKIRFVIINEARNVA